MFFRSGVFLLLAFVLTGCTTSVSGRQDTARQIAQAADFKPFSVQTGMFKIAGFVKSAGIAKVASVYIEGDGFAWIDRYTISDNPTPRNPLGLRLATMDPTARVIYLARPCQYVDLDLERFCNNKYWSGSRFSSDVIKSYNQVLDDIKKRFAISGFNLVGFSGGGAVAVLVASKRSDVLSIRTVAGNLDHVTLNRRHNVSPLRGSLNAADVADKVSYIPQIHFFGSQDNIIGKYIADSYRNRAGRTECISIRRVPGASHNEGWTDVWRKLVAMPLPACH